MLGAVGKGFVKKRNYTIFSANFNKIVEAGFKIKSFFVIANCHRPLQGTKTPKKPLHSEALAGQVSELSVSPTDLCANSTDSQPHKLHEVRL